jgi:hypothetical protein
MAEWFFSNCFGRFLMALVVCVIGALIATDETNKLSTRSGRVSVRMVVIRVFSWASIPVWIFFVVFGFFWVNMPGEIKCAWDQPIQTEWTYIEDNLAMFAAWYAGSLAAFVVLGVLSTGVIDFLNNNDPSYEMWRKTGGQPFIDNLPSFLENDPES